MLDDLIRNYDDHTEDAINAKLRNATNSKDITEIIAYLCSTDNACRQDLTMNVIEGFLEQVLPTFIDWLDDI